MYKIKITPESHGGFCWDVWIEDSLVDLGEADTEEEALEDAKEAAKLHSQTSHYTYDPQTETLQP